MRISIVAAILLALPAHAEGRKDLILTCAFTTETVDVFQNGGAYRIEMGGMGFPAGLARPGSEGRIVGIFAMIDAGPMMIAVETTAGEAVHRAEVTATTLGPDGPVTRTTPGTCTEATP